MAGLKLVLRRAADLNSSLPINSASSIKKSESILITLEREENKFFRRSHYFWYMREQAVNLPFLRKFITLNTLFLEGDYKRNCDRPIREAFSDLIY